jgi:hypothetical protein
LSSEPVPTFNIDTNGSVILVLEMSGPEYIYYQRSSNGEFVELTERLRYDRAYFVNWYILDVPLPGSQIITQTFEGLQGSIIYSNNLERLQLSEIDDDLINEIYEYFKPIHRDQDYDLILNVLNGQSVQVEKSIEQLSYETYIKNLSGIPIILPEYLIINGLKVYLIPFDQVRNIQTERYIIDPILQPWTDASNRIVTIFGKDGMTYLVKAKYDSINHQIFPY